jgi:signal transduction histidine kinase
MKKRLIRQFQAVSKLMAVLVVIMSLLVITGWLLEINWLTKIISRSSPMSPVTAFACILAAGSLFCIYLERTFYWNISRILSVGVMVIGAWRLFQLGSDLPDEQALELSSSLPMKIFAGELIRNIAPNTAAALLLIGLSLILYHTRLRNRFYPADLLSLLASLISFTSLIGYLYEGNSLYKIRGQIAMSLPGAIILFLMAVSVLLSRSAVGELRLITGDHPGSRMARYLIPFALLLPVLTGLFRAFNESYDIMEESAITAVIIMVNIVVMVTLIWRAAKSMNSSSVCLAQEKHQSEMLKEKLRIEENRQLKNSLMETKLMQQKAIIAATIEGQEKEKKQLGMELHDHINQILASTKLYLELASTERDLATSRQLVKKSSEQINTVIQEIRQLSHSLVLHDTGKKSVLEDIASLVNKVNELAPIAVHTNISAGTIEKLDRPVQVGIYRILQEQLQNIVKHSRASVAEVDIWEEQGQVHISIKDNGKGFDPMQKSSGIGFKNIDSRVTNMEGQMNIITDPGKGCELRISIPMICAARPSYNGRFSHKDA